MLLATFGVYLAMLAVVAWEDLQLGQDEYKLKA